MEPYKISCVGGVVEGGDHLQKTRLAWIGAQDCPGPIFKASDPEFVFVTSHEAVTISLIEPGSPTSSDRLPGRETEFATIVPFVTCV